MVTCLYLYHPTVTSLTKCKLLRSIFHGEDFEIQVIENNTVIIYIWNMEITYIWKAIQNFEIANIKVGYGFGKIKEEANDAGLKHLTLQQNKIRNQSIKHWFPD